MSDDEEAIARADAGLADVLERLERLQALVLAQAPLAEPLVYPLIADVRLYILTMHQTWSDTMDENWDLIQREHGDDLQPA